MNARHKPTLEQEAAIEAFLTGGSLKINAYAGTGKTSTLTMLAEATKRRGQYIAFNKSIVHEAKGKFPENIYCATSHSMAYRELSGKYSFEKLTQTTNAKKLREELQYKSSFAAYGDFGHIPIVLLTPYDVCHLCLRTIDNFCNSDDAEIMWYHIPWTGNLVMIEKKTDKRQLNEMVLDLAKRVWKKMLDPSSDIPLGHNGYLKVWTLMHPVINADFILLDEAQDTNGAVLSVLLKQKSQIVYVGDKYQQIYAWRGAINAMEKIETPMTSVLTKSFRFGDQIAEFATDIIRHLDCDDEIQGNNRLEWDFNREPRVILARTNAQVIRSAIQYLQMGWRPHIMGGGGELEKIVQEVMKLEAGKKSNLPDFFGFANWDEVIKFAKTPAGEGLVPIVNLVAEFGSHGLMRILNRLEKKEKASIIISTAHKAKGLEWQDVYLEEDFLLTRRMKHEVPRSELQLFYVAATRARQKLEVNPKIMQIFNELDSPCSSWYVQGEEKEFVDDDEDDEEEVNEKSYESDDEYQREYGQAERLSQACAVFGMQVGLSKEEYKRMYLKKVKANHPDLYADADDMIREAANAATRRYNDAWAIIDGIMAG